MSDVSKKDYDAVLFDTSGCQCNRLHVALNDVTILTLCENSKVAQVKRGKELEAIAWMVQYLTGVLPRVEIVD